MHLTHTLLAALALISATTACCVTIHPVGLDGDTPQCLAPGDCKWPAHGRRTHPKTKAVSATAYANSTSPLQARETGCPFRA